MGATRFQPGSCCGCQGTKICVAVSCSGTNNAVAGAVIELFTGSTQVASCTANSTGCCTFAQSGTFTVKVFVGGVLQSSTSRTLSGTPITITIGGPPTGFTCCGTDYMPTALFWTDFTGTTAVTLGVPQGSCSSFAVASAITIICPLGFGVADCQLGAGTVGLYYTVTCVPGPPAKLKVDAYAVCGTYGAAIPGPTPGQIASNCPWAGAGAWYAYVFSGAGTQLFNAFGIVGPSGGYTSCSDGQPGITPAALIGTLTSAPSSWNPLSWSGTLIDQGTGCILPNYDVALGS